MRTYQTLFADRRLASAECGAGGGGGGSRSEGGGGGEAQGGDAEGGTRTYKNKNKNSERKGFSLSGETPLLCLEAALRFFPFFFLFFWTYVYSERKGFCLNEAPLLFLEATLRLFSARYFYFSFLFIWPDASSLSRGGAEIFFLCFFFWIPVCCERKGFCFERRGRLSSIHYVYI